MDERPLWTWYEVRFDFITKLCASVPADPDLIKKWLETRQPRVRPPGGRTIDEINEEVLASLPEEEEQVNILTFQRNPTNGSNLVLRAATLRAHMKDCANVISSHFVGKIEGERSFAVKVKNCVYHDELIYWIPILRPDGSQILASDGQHQKPIHANVKGRPVNALKCFDFVYPARIDFKIKVLGGVVKKKDLETLFMYGGTHGYGGERSDGEGRYTFVLNEMEEKDNAKEKNVTAKHTGSQRGARVAVQ